MREIKFRYRIKNMGQINSRIFTLKDIEEGKTKIDLISNQIISKDEFTGLKDKNGKEIYVGDILTNGHNNFECIFWKGSFVANLISSEKKKEQGYLALEILEVIGNIYENPELLKGVKE